MKSKFANILEWLVNIIIFLRQTLRTVANDSISQILLISSVLILRVNYLLILIVVWNLKLVQVVLGFRVPYVFGDGVYSW